MATTIKSRFPLLLLLGITFLASVCVSYGIAHYEQGNPCYEKCLQRYNKVNGALKHHECQSSCEEEGDDEHQEHRVPGRRERGRQEGEKEEQRPEQWRPSHEREEDEEDERQERRPEQWRPSPGGRQEGQEERPGQWRPSREKEEDEKEERQKHQPGREREKWEKREGEEWRGSQRYEDPEERARLRYREKTRQEEEEHQKRDRPSSRSSRGEREEEEEEGSSSESQGRRNPFFFRSKKFQTLFENENGHIRLLERFDKSSNLFQNLQNYRLVEYRAKPNTIFLPHHIDADFVLVVLSGKAIITVLNPNNRNSFNLESGDTIKIPAGTTAYIVNQDNDEDLRVVDLVIPVNRPGKFQSFGPSENQHAESYFRGFSKSILEASFNTNYEIIERVLLEEKERDPQQRRGRQGRQQSQEADAIVKISREQIEELRRHAKSSSKKSISSESEPFNLRSRNPIYSNKFGKFFEITPEKNPQLQDLDISVSSVEINEGALLLPHYNSRVTVVLVINEGKGNLELVGHKSEQEAEREEHDEEDERNREVQRYRARLSPGDVVIIPAGHPVAVNASSNLNLIGFGINAENNQRNFLAGENDNVISQIERPVKELAFPGSAEEVERLIKNQRESYFANAQPQQREEERQKGKGPLFSILNTLY